MVVVVFRSRLKPGIEKEIEAMDAQGGGDVVGKAAATPDQPWVARRADDVGSGADDPPP